MFQKQKETIVDLLRSAEENQDYQRHYWFSYQDFLDPTDSFTDFSCENLDGKQAYITLIENLLNADESAKIFVEVYGLETDENDEFIYAETLIIFSTLPLPEIERIFNEPSDIFPSDIGILTDSSEQIFIIGDKGNLLPTEDLFNSNHSVYYCWWD